MHQSLTVIGNNHQQSSSAARKLLLKQINPDKENLWSDKIRPRIWETGKGKVTPH